MVVPAAVVISSPLTTRAKVMRLLRNI